MDHDGAVSSEKMGDDQHVEAVTSRVPRPKGWMNWRFAMNIFIVGCSWGMYAYDNTFVTPMAAVPSFLIKYHAKDLAVGTFSAGQLNLLVSFPLLAAAFGAFLAVPLLRRVGRKWTLITAYVVFCVPGSILQLFAPTLAAFSVGRFWNNFGISIANTASGLYLSEVAPAHVRAMVIGTAILGANAVSVLATTVVWGTEKLPDDRAYKIPLGVQLAIPGTLALLTLLITESPTWFALRDRMGDARKALVYLRGNDGAGVEAELVALEEYVRQAQAQQEVRFWDILNKKHLPRTLLAGAYASLSQVCGQILTLAFATILLVESGVNDPFLITIIIFLANFCGACVGIVLMDKVGRRPTALTGFAVVFVFDVVIGGLGSGGLKTNQQRKALAALMIVFAFFNSLTFQSIMLLLPTELPSPKLREPTVGWSVFWSYVTAIVTTFVVPQLILTAQLGARTDFIFAGCALVTFIMSYFFLPETRGRSLAEIDELCTNKVPARKWPKPQTQVAGHETQDKREEKA